MIITINTVLTDNFAHVNIASLRSYQSPMIFDIHILIFDIMWTIICRMMAYSHIYIFPVYIIFIRHNYVGKLYRNNAFWLILRARNYILLNRVTSSNQINLILFLVLRRVRNCTWPEAKYNNRHDEKCPNLTN